MFNWLFGNKEVIKTVPFFDNPDELRGLDKRDRDIKIMKRFIYWFDRGATLSYNRGFQSASGEEIVFNNCPIERYELIELITCGVKCSKYAVDLISKECRSCKEERESKNKRDYYNSLKKELEQ